MEEQSLADSRREIRSVDSQLIRLLARRFKLAKRIGHLKRKLKMGIIDPAAERSVVENLVAVAAAAGIDETYAVRVANLIIEGSVAAQTPSRRVGSKDSVLKGLSEMMLAAEKRGRKLIRLDIGEPRFRTPSVAARAAKVSLTRTNPILYGSSAGLGELADAIAARLNQEYDTEYDRSNILVFPGGRFALFAAIQSTVSSLERMALFRPAWPAYESCLGFIGARALPISTNLENGWNVDLRGLEEALRLRPKMLVLNYPSNPTGKVLSANELGEVMQLAKEYHVAVLSDEVYASYSGGAAPSALEYPDCDTIYVNSFSKEFSMTGWRIAYAAADRQRIARMRAIVQTTITNVPEFVQRAALAVLKDSSTIAERSRRRIEQRVQMACDELKKGPFEFYRPDGGFYIFPRVKRKNLDSEKFAKYLFEKYSVGVLPGTIFGDYRDFLRLAITEPEDAVRVGIRRIVKAASDW